MSDDSRRVRFGTFELDLRSGDLWRAGKRRTLQEQPLAVLKALLERPGEVVRREDLCRLLWPDGTFVDFEHGLNAAIKRLRDSLGTDAEATNLIETVPRRGYRLTAAVEPVEDPKREPEPPSRPRPWLTTWRAVGASTTLIVIGGGVALNVWLRAGSVPAEAGRAVSSLRALTQVTYDVGWTMEPAVSPDGRFLAYASDRGGGGNSAIWIQRLDGGPPRQLTHHAVNDREPAFSPDGSRIVFRSERDGGGLYTIPAHTGGREQLLAAYGHEARYSPDGRFIAYWTGIQTWRCNPAVDRTFIVPSEGGVPTLVAPQLGGACWPVWAPDSKHLLVTAQLRPDGDLHWLVVPIAGGMPVDTGLPELIEINDFCQGMRQRAWARNVIVFEAWWRGRPMNLWAASIAPETWRVQGPAERLTTASEDQNAASLAADGRLMFATYSHRLSLWNLRVKADAGLVRGAPQRVTSGVRLDRIPTVSLDGAALAFARTAGEEHEIYVVNPRTGRESLKVERGPVHSPSISPDGSKIAYGRTNDIDVMNAADAQSERISVDSGPVVPEGWSHDNDRLLYVDHPDGEARIFVVSLETGGKRLLAARPGHALYQARFSPDDQWVSFVEQVGNGLRIWVAGIPPSGAIPPAAWIAVTDAASWNDKPRWSPNGRLLYFISDRDGFRCIWAQRVDPLSRRPAGAAFAVYHLHAARLSMMNADLGNVGFDVARDSLIFNMGERTGNIWTTTIDLKQ